MIILFSKLTKELSANEINEIINLKDEHWKYGGKNQKKFFKKNLKNNDIHNLLYVKKKLIGYTALRHSNYKNQKNIIIKYLHLDTIIIKKDFRKKRYSILLMFFNNFIIKKNNKTSILFCNSNLINFYKKFNWKILKKFFILNIKSKPKKLTMVYNLIN
jgi:ribosomal protein L4